MPQTMTLDEKLDIGLRSVKLRKTGDLEGADRLLKTAPLPPYIAKIIKEKVWLEFI